MTKRLPIVKQRTKKDSLSVTNYFGDTKAKFEIKAFQEDWSELYNNFGAICLEKDLDTACLNLGRYFYSSFMIPASEKITKYNSWKQMVVHDLKMLAGFYYTFFQYCFENIPKNLPPNVKALAAREDFATYASHKKPIDYTAYCLQAEFGEVAAHFDLKPFYDPDDIDRCQGPDSFYVAYIHEGRNMIKNIPPIWIRSFWTSVYESMMKAMGKIDKDMLEKLIEGKLIALGRGDFHCSLASAFLWDPTQNVSEEVMANKKILLNLYPNLYNYVIEEAKIDNPFPQ